MASRMIHYLIGREVVKRIFVANPGRFVVGNLLPDCVDEPGRKGGLKSGAKTNSHFFGIDMERGLKGANWNLFCDKYPDYMEDELYLGYMCHLLSDAVWFHDINHSLIRILPEAERGIYLEKMYRDYHRMNELLREEYALIPPQLIWQEDGPEEPEPEFWDTYMQAFQQDFCKNTGAKKENLELLKYDMVVDYIGKAVRLCCEEILAKREGKRGIAPEIFYVPEREHRCKRPVKGKKK